MQTETKSTTSTTIDTSTHWYYPLADCWVLYGTSIPSIDGANTAFYDQDHHGHYIETELYSSLNLRYSVEKYHEKFCKFDEEN